MLRSALSSAARRRLLRPLLIVGTGPRGRLSVLAMFDSEPAASASRRPRCRNAVAKAFSSSSSIAETATDSVRGPWGSTFPFASAPVVAGTTIRRLSTTASTGLLSSKSENATVVGEETSETVADEKGRFYGGGDGGGGHLASLYSSMVRDGSVSYDLHQDAALTELDRLRDEILDQCGDGDGAEGEGGRDGAGGGTGGKGDGGNSIGDEEERESSTPWPSITDKSLPPSAGGLGSFFAGMFGSSSSREASPADSAGPPPPKGVYLHGGVGCGKTFVMDLFYDSIPMATGGGNGANATAAITKQKVHFHKFMLGVHRQMHEAKMVEGVEGDVLPRVIERTIRDGRLICFDEFQVTDVADALILRRLFTGLLERGAVVVATSNRPPRDLYLNGLQRDRFVPFIDLLEERTVVVSMWESETDYRLVHGRKRAKGVYFVGGRAEDGDDDRRRRAKEDFDAVFAELVEADEGGAASVRPTSLTTQGRRIKVPLASLEHGVSRFSFDDLCRKALGAADYLAIAETFHTVFMEDVPVMTMNDVNLVRRFITFVDCMYECRVKLVLLAEALPKDLFVVDLDNPYQDEAFAFDRTRSRLDEMGGKAYLRRRWAGAKRREENKGDDVFVGPEPGLQY